MFEGHMSYDYRRWLIALKEWSGMENGMIGLNSYGTTNEEYYKMHVWMLNHSSSGMNSI